MNWDPAWHPDGQQLAFLSMRKGDFDAYIQRLDGSPATAVFTADADELIADWTPDGDGLIVREYLPDESNSYFLSDVAGKQRTPLVVGSFEKNSASVSPDGRWLAYCANPAGRWHVYVRSMSPGSASQQVGAAAPTSNCELCWVARTKEMTVLRGGELARIAYDDGGNRFAIKSDLLIARLSENAQLYGVTADGQKVLVGQPVTTTGTRREGLRIVLNGLEALAQPAPSR